MCPTHKTAITEVEFFESSRNENGKTSPCKLDKFDLDLAKEPGRFFNEEYLKNREIMQDKLVLSMTYVQQPDHGSNEQAETYSLTAILDSRYGFESEQDEKNLRIIFAQLYYPIFKQHKENTKNNEYNNQVRYSPGDFLDYCETKDESLLLKLLYALTTGKAYFTPPRFRNNHGGKKPYNADTELSNFYAICVAKHMLERTTTNTPGPFQQMIGDMMSMVNAPITLQNFFSKIRVSCAPKTSLRNLTIRSVTHLLTKIEYTVLDLILLAFDNFGFKGKNGKWAQHTVIQFKVIQEKELRILGFYDDYKISRVRKEMNNLMIEYKNEKIDVAESIIFPNENDYKILSERIMITMKYVATVNFPTIDECIDLIMSKGKWRTKVRSNLGVEIDVYVPVTNIKDIVNGSNRISPGWIQNKEKMNNPPQSFYETNNIDLDNVLHDDPNSTAVVQEIMDYQQELVDLDENNEDFNYSKSGQEEPVSSIILPAAADGSPAMRFLNIQSKDIDENGFQNRRYKTQRIFFGGFHFLMQLMSMRGRLTRDFTAYFARMWRKEDPRLNWIYLIRDPNDGLNEWRQYLMAHYKEVSEQSGTNNPAEMHDYIITRCIDKPLCMAILFDLRLLEIIFLTRDAEKTGKLGSVPFFLTCLRFSLILFSITHSTNYCHLVTAFLEWHALGSDADRILFENYFYTRISPHGKPTWIDRGVEWTVRHIRRFAGHRVRPQNHDEKVEQVIAEIPFHQKANKELRGLLGKGEYAEFYTTKNWNEQTFELGAPLFHTRVALRETNLWGKGDLDGDLACENANSIVLTESKGAGNKEYTMSSSILDAPTIGLNRIRDYFIEFHIDSRFPRHRRGLRDTLKTLPTTHERRLQDIEITRKIRCSTDVKDFKGLTNFFNKEQMLEELDHLRDFFLPDMPPYTDKQKQPVLLRALCEWRKIFFTEHPNLYQDALDSVEELAASESATTSANRSVQLQSMIYSLDPEVVETYRSNG